MDTDLKNLLKIFVKQNQILMFVLNYFVLCFQNQKEEMKNQTTNLDFKANDCSEKIDTLIVDKENFKIESFYSIATFKSN